MRANCEIKLSLYVCVEMNINAFVYLVISSISYIAKCQYVRIYSYCQITIYLVIYRIKRTNERTNRTSERTHALKYYNFNFMYAWAHTYDTKTLRTLKHMANMYFWQRKMLIWNIECVTFECKELHIRIDG